MDVVVISRVMEAAMNAAFVKSLGVTSDRFVHALRSCLELNQSFLF
jgi:hypothetical protein